ncbi:MAG: hypothetical protein R3E31_12605 [Chloroflexota bacterium]
MGMNGIVVVVPAQILRYPYLSRNGVAARRGVIIIPGYWLYPDAALVQTYLIWRGGEMKRLLSHLPHFRLDTLDDRDMASSLSRPLLSTGIR